MLTHRSAEAAHAQVVSSRRQNYWVLKLCRSPRGTFCQICGVDQIRMTWIQRPTRSSSSSCCQYVACLPDGQRLCTALTSWKTGRKPVYSCCIPALLDLTQSVCNSGKTTVRCLSIHCKCNCAFAGNNKNETPFLNSGCEETSGCIAFCWATHWHERHEHTTVSLVRFRSLWLLHSASSFVWSAVWTAAAVTGAGFSSHSCTWRKEAKDIVGVASTVQYFDLVSKAQDSSDSEMPLA